MSGVSDQQERVPSLLPLCFLGACVAALYCASARAEVDFEPAILVGVVRTDNLTLTQENLEAETVYELIPSFKLTQASTRVTTEAAYRLENYRYQSLRDTSTYHSFDGTFSAALQPEKFFFEAGASRGQSIRDPEVPISRSNLPIDNNRVNRDDYYSGLRFRYPLGGNASLNGSGRRVWTRFGEFSPNFGGVALNDFVDDRFDLSFDNYERGRGFTWSGSYNAVETDYDIGVPYEHRQASVELGGWVSRGVRVFARGGQESAWDEPFDPTLRDPFWEVGFSKQGGNIEAELAAGERSYGESRRARLGAKFRRLRTDLSYAEEPTTNNQDRYNAILIPEYQGDFLSRPGEAERYISKRFTFSSVLELRRVSITVSVFSESREDRTRLDGVVLGDESQEGGSISASWNVGSRTELVLGSSRADRQSSDYAERTLSVTQLSANYTVGQRTVATLAFDRTQDKSDFASDGYVADTVSLLLTRTF